MPTERARIAIAFLVITLFIAFYTQVELIFFVEGILASLLLVSFILFKITNITTLECNRSIPNAVYEGDRIKVGLRVENQSAIGSYFISLTDNFPADLLSNQQKKLTFSYLDKRAVVENVYEGCCSKRGVYWIGPLTIATSDPLGFFRKNKILNLYSKLTVYPDVFAITSLGTFNKGVVPPRYGSHTTRKSGDYEEFFGIREYQQEDGLRKIHWPSSAKHNQLMVRHFEQTGAYSATIMIDLKYGNNLGGGKETTLEYSVRIAASLAKYFLDQGFLVQLLAHSDKPIITSFGKDPSHFFNILESLAQVESVSTYSLGEVFAKLQNFIYPNSTLAVIRLDNDIDAARALEQLIYTKNMSLFDIQLISSSFDFNIPKSSLCPLEIKGSEVISYFVSRGENLKYKFISK